MQHISRDSMIVALSTRHTPGCCEKNIKKQGSDEIKEAVAMNNWRMLQSEACESLPPYIRWKLAELCRDTILYHYVVCGDSWNQEWFPIGFIYPTSAQFYDYTIAPARSTTAVLNCQKTACSTSAEGPEIAAGRNAEDPVHSITMGALGRHKFPVEKSCNVL